MALVERSVLLRASAGSVWAFISNPENFSRYVQGYQGGVVTTAAATGLGSAFRWEARLAFIRLSSEERVVEWEDNRRVAYEGSMAGVTFRSSMTLSPRAGEACALSIAIEYRIPTSRGGLLTDRFVVRPLVLLYVAGSLRRLAAHFGSP